MSMQCYLNQLTLQPACDAHTTLSSQHSPPPPPELASTHYNLATSHTGLLLGMEGLSDVVPRLLQLVLAGLAGGLAGSLGRVVVHMHA